MTDTAVMDAPAHGHVPTHSTAEAPARKGRPKGGGQDKRTIEALDELDRHVRTFVGTRGITTVGYLRRLMRAIRQTDDLFVVELGTDQTVVRAGTP